MGEENQWLDSIEKYVFEDGKIVTYKWLSRQLNIHVNISKRLLSTFISKADEQLGVCYVIGGVLPDGSHRILVGKQEKLSDIKSLFKSITSEHVYSVQKNNTSNDLKVALYSADSCVVQENGTKLGCSAIRCKDSIVRNVADLKRNVLINQKSTSAEIGGNKKNVSDGKKLTSGSEKENLLKSNSVNGFSDTNGVKKSDSDSPKKSGIAGMFAKQKDANPPKVNSTNGCADMNGVKKSDSSPKKKTGIAAMFANQKDGKKPDDKAKVVKQQSKTKPKGLSTYFNQSKENKIDEKTNKPEELSESESTFGKGTNDSTDAVQVNEKPSKDFHETQTAVKNVKEDSLSADIPKNAKTKDKLIKSKGSQKSGKKRKKEKYDDAQGKKRKRIVMISDSESTDEEEHERSPSPVPREATPPPPPLSEDEDTVPATPQAGKKAKKKKLVEKTFLDEDGFLVTHKEYEFVSSSEDEEHLLNKKQGDTSDSQKPVEEEQKNKKTLSEQPKNKICEPKKKTSPQKVKQSSIMNFFGKKS